MPSKTMGMNDQTNDKFWQKRMCHIAGVCRKMKRQAVSKSNDSRDVDCTCRSFIRAHTVTDQSNNYVKTPARDSGV